MFFLFLLYCYILVSALYIPISQDYSETCAEWENLLWLRVETALIELLPGCVTIFSWNFLVSPNSSRHSQCFWHFFKFNFRLAILIFLSIVERLLYAGSSLIVSACRDTDLIDGKLIVLFYYLHLSSSLK